MRCPLGPLYLTQKENLSYKYCRGTSVFLYPSFFLHSIKSTYGLFSLFPLLLPLPSIFFSSSKRFESISCPTNAVYPLGCETSALSSQWLLELFLHTRSLRLFFFFFKFSFNFILRKTLLKSSAAARHIVRMFNCL